MRWDIAKIIMLRNLLKDLFFSRELSTVEPTQSIRHEEIERAKVELFQRRLYPGGLAHEIERASDHRKSGK